jgi:aryl-alcohol dehydrogenase-like predicted oxidoreductase
MRYRKLGNTGIEVSEIGMGCNTVAGDGSYGPQDEADGIAAIRRAHELGVTFFDTAEGYGGGQSEEALGKALGGRPNVVICTKVAMRSMTPEKVREAAQKSLARLQRDVIDVYLLHNPSIEQVQDPAYRQAMSDLQRDGLIRSYGVSVTTGITIPESKEVLKQGGYSSMELEVNLVHNEPAEEVLPAAQAQGVGIIVRVPLGAGLLTGKYTRETQFSDADSRGNGRYRRDKMDEVFDRLDTLQALAQKEGVPLSQAALAWILTNDGVSTIIPGARNVGQVEANVAAEDVKLSGDFLAGVKALPPTTSVP